MMMIYNNNNNKLVRSILLFFPKMLYDDYIHKITTLQIFLDLLPGLKNHLL